MYLNLFLTVFLMLNEMTAFLMLGVIKSQNGITIEYF